MEERFQAVLAPYRAGAKAQRNSEPVPGLPAAGGGPGSGAQEAGTRAHTCTLSGAHDAPF